MAIPRAFSSLSLTLLLVVAPLCTMADYVLYPGGALGPGRSLINGNYTLVMQTDCNLVLYNVCEAIWSSNTNGQATNCFLTFATNGNLVILNPDGNALWSNNQSGGQGNHVLVLHDDGNAVVYGRGRWDSGTNLPSSRFPPADQTTNEAEAAGVAMVINK
ncbi:alpha-D-mannose-specific plant lectins domain-containing protein [Dioscorea alata]|uniref:Alpha-D-mannose-specific plant lectins domain-containing protein n=1 Tax=Dioscorea alata TaxID=55571 RepID=A0ACB7U9T7_DIOAL|nr:alpha-D-mannose-specific plant lectins domain-containing protein [Dioscorea alata]